MPRESIESKQTRPLAVAAVAAPVARLEPPADLTDRAAQIWRAATRARAPGFFVEAHEPLLRQYANASAEAERIEAAMCGLDLAADLGGYAKLARLLDVARARASQAAVRLGIAPSAAMDTRSKGRAAAGQAALTSAERTLQNYRSAS